MSWKDDLLKRVVDKEKEDQKKLDRADQHDKVLRDSWDKILKVISNLDSKIQPKSTSDATSISLTGLDGQVLTFFDYKNCYIREEGLKSGIVYYIDIIDSIKKVCIYNEVVGHIIKEDDYEIIVRNFLMNYPTLTDLEADINPIYGDWKTVEEINRGFKLIS